MCLACVAASSPEIVVVLGGYAASRWGRPLQRLRSLFGRTAERGHRGPAGLVPITNQHDQDPRPAGLG